MGLLHVAPLKLACKWAFLSGNLFRHLSKCSVRLIEALFNNIPSSLLNRKETRKPQGKPTERLTPIQTSTTPTRAKSQRTHCVTICIHLSLALSVLYANTDQFYFYTFSSASYYKAY